MTNPYDKDPQETGEWLAALDSLVEREGAERAQYIINEVLQKAELAGVNVATQLKTPYCNSIPSHEQPEYPGDLAIEQRIEAVNRWNTVMMVMRAKRDAGGVGGHISSYNSLATVYEVGLNHYFHGRSDKHMGDLVYFQGHSSEGNYARAYLEGRLDEKHLENFRQEVGGHGLSSYPHPWLMPNFWQFATVSLGLGQLQGVYAARFLRYLEHRQLAETKDRHVWVFCGDGEMDEPESRAGLCLAANEGLDNLTFLINCNLQRLDGLVRSNYKIVDELEGLFKGSGWNVIKVLWGSGWDKLFEKDTTGELLKAFSECVDGDFQTFKANGGAYIREHFFGRSEALKALVADMTDEEIEGLHRGGHDALKIAAAFDRAKNHKGQPTVILFQGIKGYGLGEAAESKNVAHNQIELSFDQLKAFRDRFNLPIKDKDVEALAFYHPGEKSEEVKYLLAQRKKLGGFVPERFSDAPTLKAPALSEFDAITKGTGDREMSTTMAWGRLLAQLLKDKTLGKYVVPIFSDEVRTFGMEALFRQVGIYSPWGQRYTPEDKKQLMYYKEAEGGQILMEGITEAGCMASFIAAATAYSTSGVPMIPMFIYYSMFGFQRVGDFIWAAADMRARGFLVGGTAGRTALEGEGLQHQDGHSLLAAATVPTCMAYDPTFGYEMAVILCEGLRRMYEKQEDVFYYVTAMNEKYPHPAMPKGCEDGILKGMYLLKAGKKTPKTKATLLGSGAILREVLAAAELLEKDFKISADVWSATSFNELRRDALDVERYNRLNADKKQKMSYVETCLAKNTGPVIAATDYMRAYPDQIRAFVPTDFHVLGTDGFGRSDTRAALRHFFEVDRHMIAYTTVYALVNRGELPKEALAKARKTYKIDPKKANPVTV